MQRPLKPCKHCKKPIKDRDPHATVCWWCYHNHYKAHDKVRQITRAAVAKGALPHPKSLTCVDCGKPAICYDHRDYNNPLEVIPVCKPCNSSRGAGIPLKKEYCKA